MAKKKKTSAIQVPGWLHTAITKYANEHGISQAEASERIFQVLYPEGVLEQPSEPIAPTQPSDEGEEAGERAGLEEEAPEDVSGELGKTVKDLRTVHTIRALQKGLDKDEEEEWHLTPKEAFEMRKIEKMFGGGSNKEGNLGEALQSLEDRLLAQMKALMAEKETDKVAEERDYYKTRLEDKEKAEQRAEEMAQILTPIQEQINLLAKSLEALREEMKPESKTPPTSSELEAIRTLGANIKDAIIEVKQKGVGGGEADKLKDYLDSLVVVMDKITEFAGKKGEAPSGEFDWRTAGITTFGEVATEAIRAVSEIESGKRSEEETKEERPGLSKQIIERRVYNYALKKIASGELSIDPYKAGEELGLTPNQVWEAVESLRSRGALSRGALKTPQVSETEKKKPEEKAAEIEGGEGEIGPVAEA